MLTELKVHSNNTEYIQCDGAEGIGPPVLATLHSIITVSERGTNNVPSLYLRVIVACGKRLSNGMCGLPPSGMPCNQAKGEWV